MQFRNQITKKESARALDQIQNRLNRMVYDYMD